MYKKTFLAISALLFSPVLCAGELVKIPTEWRVDNLPDGNIKVYYSGSACTNGQLDIESSADANFKNRFISIVMASKMAQKKIQVLYYYNDTADTCNITKVVIPRDSEPLT